MCNLLSANFMRLRKEKVFWIMFCFMLALGIIFPTSIKIDEVRTGYVNNIDNIFGQYAMFIGIVMAIFCSFFVGKEYSDQTIRNKIISGKKRTDIYLANFISCAAASIILCVVFFLSYLCIGITLLGFFTIDINIVFLFLLTVIALSVAFSSIFNLIAMLSVNKAVTAVICILSAFIFLFIGMQLNKMMNEPETILGMTITETGESYEETPNPKYLNDKERRLVQFAYDFLPGGQVVQCVAIDAANLPMLPVYSFIIIVSTTGIGLFCFKRKALK